MSTMTETSAGQDAEFRDIIRELGVTVIDGELPDGWWGGYDHGVKLIILRPGLAPLQRRSVLAHELGHAVHGHKGHQDEAGEREACEWAANFLISSPDSFGPAATTANLRGLLSHRLRVMPSDITTYVRMHGAEVWSALMESEAITGGLGWNGIDDARHRTCILGMPEGTSLTPTQALRDSIEGLRSGTASADDLHELLNRLESGLCLRPTKAED